MRKILVLVLAVMLVCFMSGAVMAVGPSQTFTFNATVDPYIAVNPGAILAINIPAISPPQNGSMPGILTQVTQNEVAYANCPFRVDYAGNNAAGDNLPILARLETGPHSGGYDRLQTRLEFHSVINGDWNGAVFGAGPTGDGTGVPNTWAWGRNYAVNAVPHDGEVGLVLKCGASLPHASPEFGVNNTWDQSADAGPYTCYVVATYTAL